MSTAGLYWAKRVPTITRPTWAPVGKTLKVLRHVVFERRTTCGEAYLATVENVLIVIAAFVHVSCDMATYIFKWEAIDAARVDNLCQTYPFC